MPLITRSHHFHWNVKKGQLTLAHLSEDSLSIASMKNFIKLGRQASGAGTKLQVRIK